MGDSVAVTREAFLAPRALPRATVEIEGMGVLMVQGLTGKQRDEYESSCVVQKGNKRSFNLIDARAKLVALSVIDPATGKRLFTNDDVSALSAMPALYLDRLFSVAQRLSGITDEDIADLGKLSDGGLGASSSSGSPDNSEA